jgi:membrane-bound metal-dependent hydrolase YbcI (DUF457 family)
MSPLGHNITSISIGFTSALYFANDYYNGPLYKLFIDAIKWIATGIIQNDISNAPTAFLFIFFFLGFVSGSTAPNWLEPRIVFDGTLRFVRNRTLYHAPWLWLAGLAPLIYWATIAKYSLLEFVNWGLIGFVCSGLLHILIDFFSSEGSPLIFPNGRKYAIGLYATRTFQEIYLLLPIISIPMIYLYLNK